jgi:hypothetical protein
MRLTRVVVLSLAAIGASVPLAAAEPPLDLPLRKAGLWQVHTQTDEGSGVQKQDLTMCIGEEMERIAVRASGADNRANCATYEVSKTTAGTTIDAVCSIEDRKVVTRTELTGNFTSEFSVKVDSTTSGHAPRSQGGQPVNVHRIILQDGKYLGEACGELQAGEAKGADGRTLKVQ